MATRNIVPRVTNEGSIGTTAKRWLNGFFDNLTLGRVSVNNSDMSPIDNDTVNLGAALRRWLNGFFKKVTTQVLTLSSGGEEKSHLWTDPSNGNTGFTIQQDSAKFIVASHNLSGEEVLLIHLNPDAGVALYDKGLPTFEIAEKSAILNGGRPIVFSSDLGNITFKGSVGGWAEGLVYQGNLGTERGTIGAHGGDDDLNYFFMGKTWTDTGLRVYPDGPAILYYDGVQQLTTTSDGISAKASAHGAGSTPQISNTVYGTGSPPAVGSVPEGTVFYKYI